MSLLDHSIAVPRSSILVITASDGISFYEFDEFIAERRIASGFTLPIEERREFKPGINFLPELVAVREVGSSNTTIFPGLKIGFTPVIA